jgi:hypothetical protein
MNKNLVLAICSLVIFSCNSKSDEYNSPDGLTKVPEAASSGSTAAGDSTNPLLIPQTKELPGVQQINTQQQTTTNQQQVTTTTVQPTTVQPTTATTQPLAANAGKAGANPEHGKPGHRCDIPVGAPLNSPATNTTTTATNRTEIKPTTTTSTATVMPTTQPAQKTAPGMNPPHGEPGHRCDIAVGAPLNSPATKATTPTTTTATNPTLPAVNATTGTTDSSKK